MIIVVIGIAALMGAIAIGQHLRISAQLRQLDATRRQLDATRRQLDAAHDVATDQVKINNALRTALRGAYSEIKTLRATIPVHHASTIAREENWRNQ